jgi:hypothetical protein
MEEVHFLSKPDFDFHLPKVGVFSQRRINRRNVWFFTPGANPTTFQLQLRLLNYNYNASVVAHAKARSLIQSEDNIVTFIMH